MSFNREGNFNDGTNRSCTNCGVIFKLTSKTVTLCNTCNSDRVKSQSPEKRMLARAKTRAKLKGVPFSIELEDIHIPEFCPVLGMKIEVNSGKSGAYPNSPSLDKIIPELGYVKGNVQVLSQLANSMKNSASKDQLLKFADWVYLNFGKE